MSEKTVDVEVKQPTIDTSEKNKLKITSLTELFYFSYRARYEVKVELVRGADLTTVKRKAVEYCSRHGLIFISVRPALLDLDRGLRNKQLVQEDLEKPAEPVDVKPISTTV
jgi:hypothetical protein